MLRFETLVEVDGKPEPNKWTDNSGKERLSYKLNISQNEGRDVATIGCTENLYNAVRRRDTLKAVFAFSEGGGANNSKPYLKLESAEIVNLSKPVSGQVNAPSGVPTK